MLKIRLQGTLKDMPDRQSRNMQEISRCQDLWHYNKVGKGWYEYE